MDCDGEGEMRRREGEMRQMGPNLNAELAKLVIRSAESVSRQRTMQLSAINEYEFHLQSSDPSPPLCKLERVLIVASVDLS